MSVVTKALREAYKGVLHVMSRIVQANNALLSLCYFVKSGCRGPQLHKKKCVSAGLGILVSLESPPSRKP